jgi:anti-sigma factor RsiW
MKCNDVYVHVCDSLDENLDSPKCRAIKKHLAKCPDCQSYLQSVKTTIALYKAAPAPRMPMRAHRELFKTLAVLTETSGERSVQQKAGRRR